jgi:hypothetical protein
MPIINLRLNSKRYSVEANEVTETESLRADASIIEPKWRQSTFAINHEGKTYNGYAGSASLTIKPRPPRVNAPGTPISKQWEPDDEGRDMFRVDLYGAPGSEAYYQCTLYAQEEVFRRIAQANLKLETIFVVLENEVHGQDLQYGADPDGGDIIWNIGPLHHVFLRSVTFIFESTANENVPAPPDIDNSLYLRQLVNEHYEAMKVAIDRLSGLAENNSTSLSKFSKVIAAILFFILLALIFR